MVVSTPHFLIFFESRVRVGLSSCRKNRSCFACSTVQRQLESYSCKITVPFHAITGAMEEDGLRER